MPGNCSWMPYAPQGVKGLDDDECIEIAAYRCSELHVLDPYGRKLIFFHNF